MVMVNIEARNYAWWQQSLFWVSWLLLLVPAVGIGYGFSLVSSLLLTGYSQMIDLVLALIMGTALVELLLIAIYTFTRFWSGESTFGRLLLWLVLGAFVIPLAALLGCIYSYANLGHYLL